MSNVGDRWRPKDAEAQVAEHNYQAFHSGRLDPGVKKKRIKKGKRLDSRCQGHGEGHFGAARKPGWGR